MRGIDLAKIRHVREEVVIVKYEACDECGARGRKLLDIDNHVYCSRECYLDFCKRKFDVRWMELLKEPRNKKLLIKVPKIA
jgi:hypothetical protein